MLVDGFNCFAKFKASYNDYALCKFYYLESVILEDITILVLFGKGLEFIDSKVFLPIIIVFPYLPNVVSFLNILRSEGIFHGRVLFFPIPLLSDLATTMS